MVLNGSTCPRLAGSPLDSPLGLSANFANGLAMVCCVLLNHPQAWLQLGPNEDSYVCLRAAMSISTCFSAKDVAKR